MKILMGGLVLTPIARTISTNQDSGYNMFTQAGSPTFDYFLSCGIPGTVEGERYKKSPELVRAFVDGSPRFTAAVFITAPAPVITAQPMIAVTSRGASGRTFTTYCSSASV